MVRDVSAPYGMATAWFKVFADVESLTVLPITAILAIAHIFPINRVAHSSEETGVVEAGIVVFTIVSMVTNRTIAFIEVFAHITTCSSILAGGGSTGIEAGTVLVKVTNRTLALKLRFGNIDTQTSILAGLTCTRVEILTGVTKIAHCTNAVVFPIRYGFTRRAIVT